MPNRSQEEGKVLIAIITFGFPATYLLTVTELQCLVLTVSLCGGAKLEDEQS